MCPFGLKLCQNLATASPNPMEPLWTPQTLQDPKDQRISDFSPSPPYPPLIPLLAPWAIALRLAPPGQFTLVSFAMLEIHRVDENLLKPKHAYR